MPEGLNLKDQLPKAIDGGCFCLTDGEALVAQGKRRRSTEGAKGTNTGHKNGEAMASVGVRLTDQLGATPSFDYDLPKRCGLRCCSRY